MLKKSTDKTAPDTSGEENSVENNSVENNSALDHALEAKWQPWRLEIRDLCAGYVKNQPVIQNFSAELTGPGLWLVQGSNGSGKSTLLEVFSGFLPPMSGHVLLNGEDLHHEGFTHSVSLLRHDPELVPFLSLGDNLALFARRYGAPQSRIDELVDALELQPHLRKLPSELSTGTLRKGWLICGLLNHSPVVAFDEPLNGLDSGAADLVAALLLEKSQHQLVVIIAHHLPERLAEVMPGQEPLEGSAGPLRCALVTQSCSSTRSSGCRRRRTSSPGC